MAWHPARRAMPAGSADSFRLCFRFRPLGPGGFASVPAGDRDVKPAGRLGEERPARTTGQEQEGSGLRDFNGLAQQARWPNGFRAIGAAASQLWLPLDGCSRARLGFSSGKAGQMRPEAGMRSVRPSSGAPASTAQASMD